MNVNRVEVLGVGEVWKYGGIDNDPTKTGHSLGKYLHGDNLQGLMCELIRTL